MPPAIIRVRGECFFSSILTFIQFKCRSEKVILEIVQGIQTAMSQSFFSFLQCQYAYVCVSVCVYIYFRGRQAMWLKAVITPETGPGLHSSHMSMKTNSRVLRHTHVSSEMCYFYVIILFFFKPTKSFIFRFHKIAGQLWIVHRCIWDSDGRRATREQTLHWCHNGDRFDEGAYAALLTIKPPCTAAVFSPGYPRICWENSVRI